MRSSCGAKDPNVLAPDGPARKDRPAQEMLGNRGEQGKSFICPRRMRRPKDLSTLLKMTMFGEVCPSPPLATELDMRRIASLDSRGGCPYVSGSRRRENSELGISGQLRWTHGSHRSLSRHSDRSEGRRRLQHAHWRSLIPEPESRELKKKSRAGSTIVPTWPGQTTEARVRMLHSAKLADSSQISEEPAHQ